MYHLMNIGKTRKGFTVKELAVSERCLDFKQGRKALETKGLGWIMMSDDEILAYFIPKSFGIKTLAELDAQIVG